MKRYLLLLVFLTLSGCNSPDLKTFTTNGVTLDYSVTGQGSPLYLLHGGMESRDSFVNQTPIFSMHYTVVALDSREQGRSGTSDAQITYTLMAQDVDALATHLGHERISIMGLSDGGITALTLALNKPERIDRLVLLGATFHYDAYPADMRDFIANYEWACNTDPNQYPGNFIQHYLTGHDDLSNFGETLKEMSVMWTTSPTYTVADLQNIKAKTLVINGDRQDTAISHATTLYENLPNAELFIVPNSTHYGIQEKPDLINKVVLDFLAE